MLDPADPSEPEIVFVPSLHTGLLSEAAVPEKAVKATTALPALGAALAAPAAEFWRRLTEGTPRPPSEVVVKLGLSFEGGSRWAVVALAGATIDVTLKWSDPPKPKGEAS